MGSSDDSEDTAGLGALLASPLSKAFHRLSSSLAASESSKSEGTFAGSSDGDGLGGFASCFLFLACSLVRPRGMVGNLNGDGDVSDSEESDESEEMLIILGLDDMIGGYEIRDLVCNIEW